MDWIERQVPAQKPYSSPFWPPVKGPCRPPHAATIAALCKKVRLSLTSISAKE